MNDDELLALNEGTTEIRRFARALAESLAPVVRAMVRAPEGDERDSADRAKNSAEVGVGKLRT
jgi:hypothetical protein